MDKIRSSTNSPLTKRQKQTMLTQISEASSAKKSTLAKRKKIKSTTQQTLIQMIAVTPESQKEGTLVKKIYYRTLSFSYRSRQLNYVSFDCAQPGDLVMGMANQIRNSAYMEEQKISARFMVFRQAQFFSICELR